MTSSPLQTRLAGVLARIDAACVAAGRDRSEVRLLAATKTRSADEIIAGVVAGLTLVGENRAQELRDKFAPVAAGLPPGVPAPEWHFIGPLQRNKVKYVVGRATLIHAVDSLKLAEELSKRAEELDASAPAPAGPPIGVLVEVNTGDEESKAGVPPSHALALCREIQALPHLALRGLMTIPPNTDRPEDAAPYFELLAELASRGRAEGLPLTELSMGMSGDLDVAIAHGATIVRVGTAIFGPRG
ncbi:MAG: YggS family pyridoxal phosphate-dependent enzyme [Alphaproteobacteria bacterium]|nr:YggS family pyridoxal phosphate-dependent enzyme [Alphaproteobacteria bacterium]